MSDPMLNSPKSSYRQRGFGDRIAGRPSQAESLDGKVAPELLDAYKQGWRSAEREIAKETTG